MCTFAQGDATEELTRAVAIDDGPISGLRDRFQAWEQGVIANVSKGFYQKFSRMMLPAISPLVDAHVMSKGRLRATIVAVAAERYRRKHGEWPELAEQLTPWPLARVPIDPCTDEPLIWLHEDHTLLIYSSGPDLSDDGGLLEQDEAAPGTASKPNRGQPYWQDKDFGFRLHDPASRHK